MMKAISLSMLMIILSVIEGVIAQGCQGKAESAKFGQPDVKIAANVPNASPVELAAPSYPSGVYVTGQAIVQIKIDKVGHVVAAQAVAGYPLLASLAVDAANKSKFKWSSAKNARRAIGKLTYDFTFTEEFQNDLLMLVGKQVTLRGKFFPAGKFGSYVLINERPVYLVRQTSARSGHSISEMENKNVAVTGTLLFHRSEPISGPVDSVVPRPPDYFYFEAESVWFQPNQNRQGWYNRFFLR